MDRSITDVLDDIFAEVDMLEDKRAAIDGLEMGPHGQFPADDESEPAKLWWSVSDQINALVMEAARLVNNHTPGRTY